MNFNILRTLFGKYWGFFIGTVVFISCNNQDSANNSTSGSKEVAADTTTAPPTPVAKAKKINASKVSPTLPKVSRFWCSYTFKNG